MEDVSCMHSKVKHEGGKQVKWSGQNPIYLTKVMLMQLLENLIICKLIMPYKMSWGVVNNMESKL